jgi:hypothetical protein
MCAADGAGAGLGQAEMPDLTLDGPRNIFDGRLPTHGGIYPSEFEKGGREMRVRVDGQLVLNSISLRPSLDLDWRTWRRIRCSLTSEAGAWCECWAIGARRTQAITSLTRAVGSLPVRSRYWSRPSLPGLAFDANQELAPKSFSALLDRPRQAIEIMREVPWVLRLNWRLRRNCGNFKALRLPRPKGSNSAFLCDCCIY